MYYSDELIEEIRERNDIVSVISEYVKLQKKGSSYFGLCPFHNEKSPSFSVSPSKQMFYCFGCGAGGNVFTFVMEYENFSFPEAVKFLADRGGIAVPEQEYSNEERQQQDLKGSILELNKKAARYYYYLLNTEMGALGLKYLKDRGLSQETIKKFGLGYSGKSGGNLYQYLKKQGAKDELLKESGLMSVDEKRGMSDKFWNRVMFPIMDVNNRVIGFGGRVMGDGKPKYLNSPETKVFDKSRNLYGLNLARTSRKKNILVCEGYMDVISLHQAGFTNSVASLGTALTSQHASLLKRYTSEIILTYDSDSAGIKAALRAIPLLKTAGLSSKVLHMEPYKDPDEFIKAMGAEEFQKRIDDAQNSFMFEISILEQDYDLQDPQGKTGFFNQVAQKLTDFEQELERENYIEAVAQKYHISFEHLRKLVNQTALKAVGVRERTPRRQSKDVEKQDGMKKSQRMLLTWLSERPALYQIVRKYIKEEDFTTPLYRQVAACLFEQLEAGNLNPAQIASQFTDAEQQREVASLFNTNLTVDTKEEMEKALKETICRIMRNSIEYQTQNLEPSDIMGLQNIVKSKRQLEEMEKLHISLE